MSTIERKGVEIYYERQGEGPAIVFAHGAGGNGAIWWQQTPYFAERYTCITFDHRCFGLSKGEVEDFLPSELGEDLLAILDAENIENAHLVCQSMGGWTGLQLTVNHPNRVKSLILCDTFGGANYEEAILTLISFAQSIGDRDVSDFALSRSFIEKSKNMKYLYDQINRFNMPLDPNSAALLLAPEVLIDSDRLKEINCPVLIIAGSLDEIFPSQMLKGFSGLFRSAEFVEFDGCGHSVFFEDAPSFNQVIEEFISKTDSDDSSESG